jgi:hypothetical protein
MLRRLPLLLLCLAALGLAALSAEAAPKQEFYFRVLDSHDRLVEKARLEVEPLAGKPEGGPGFTVGKDEVIRLWWLPQGREAIPGASDQVIRWTSAFHWRISAPGYITAVGTINRESTTRTMSDPLLAKLNQEPDTVAHGENVLLRRPEEMFAWNPKTHPPSGPLSQACEKLHLKEARVAHRLGASFAWPAFDLKGDILEIHFDWVGAPWGNQAEAPLTGKVALLTGLPLMIAVGQDLPVLPQVKNLRMVFHSAIAPPDDPYAMPVPAQVIMQAPLEEVSRLGRGEMGAREFLAAHPPRMEGGPPPAKKPAPKAEAAPKAGAKPGPPPAGAPPQGKKQP